MAILERLNNTLNFGKTVHYNEKNNLLKHFNLFFFSFENCNVPRSFIIQNLKKMKFITDFDESSSLLCGKVTH